MAKTKPVRPASSYTPKWRKQIADAFRAAKTRLVTEEQFIQGMRAGQLLICYAINSAQNDLVISESAATAAKAVVMARLGGSDSVGDWLIEHGHATNPSWPDRMTFRHRWLDELIREFSA